MIHDGKHNDCDELYHKVTASLVGYPAGGTMVGYGRVGGHCDNGSGYIGAFCMKPDLPASAVDGNLRFGACL